MQAAVPSRPIVVVDDDPDDLFFFQRSMTKGGIGHPLLIANDGEQAIATLGQFLLPANEASPKPLIAFLDLKLPRVSGFSVLEWIRARRALDAVPVAILSSSAERRDVVRAYELGALMYLVKQPQRDDLLAAIAAAQTLAEKGSLAGVKLPGLERPPPT
ncbi:MAG TPA: response regulator [Candidatus Paceibacterota bacterium]|nr:response regulator [Candidatus Paceibacterota bacterium]